MILIIFTLDESNMILLEYILTSRLKTNKKLRVMNSIIFTMLQVIWDRGRSIIFRCCLKLSANYNYTI